MTPFKKIVNKDIRKAIKESLRLKNFFIQSTSSMMRQMFKKFLNSIIINQVRKIKRELKISDIKNNIIIS